MIPTQAYFELLPIAEAIEKALFPKGQWHDRFNRQREIIKAIYPVMKK